MDFGYFTLSDNHCDNQTRVGANELVRDIEAQALYADDARPELGVDRRAPLQLARGALMSRPGARIDRGAHASRRSTARSPPSRCSTRSTTRFASREQWATLDLLSGRPRRLRRRPRIDQPRVRCRSTSTSATTRASSRRALEVVQKLVGPTEEPISHQWQALRLRRRAHHATARPGPGCRRTSPRSRRPVDRAGRPARLWARRRAVRRVDELRRPRPRSPISTPTHARSTGAKPRRLMCSYFIHFYDSPLRRRRPERARQIRYYKECVIPAFPGDPATAPPSYRYFVDMVTRLQNVTAGAAHRELRAARQFRSRSPKRLKKVEAAGFSEVILYFNVGLKPHSQVLEEMDRSCARFAPNFDGAHSQAPAALSARSPATPRGSPR